MYINDETFKRLLEIVYGIETGHSTAGEMEEAVAYLRSERNELITEGIRRRMTHEQREMLSVKDID